MANWGGARVGAGRKRKERQPRVVAHPSAPVPVVPEPAEPVGAPFEPFDAPADLEADARAVWDRQAPHALRVRTLTPERADSFARYCRMVVKERALWNDSTCNDAAHGRLRKEINALELQFKLTGDGKPIVATVVPVAQQDDDDAFFGGPVGIVRPA